MEALAITASVIVGAAFVVAGGSKLAARESWPSQARGLGAPAWVIPITPWFEIVLGAALVAQVARRPAALVAVITLAAFSALIVARLREGVRPPCACFGAWSSSPIGAGHLLRNAGLLLAAGVAAVA